MRNVVFSSYYKNIALYTHDMKIVTSLNIIDYWFVSESLL